MMNKSNPFRHLAMAVFACLMTASCSDVTDDGITLPDGKYPMTFTASVDGLSVPNPASRATTDNTWMGGETVAIQTDSDVKQYTAASGGHLTVASGAAPFYWQNNNETKKVTAWYYGTGYDATPPDGTTWAVQSDQSKTEADNTADNYRRSDFLYAPATDIPFSGRNSASLSFYHQTARVVVNIVNAEAATDASAIRSVTIGHAVTLALSGSYSAPTGAGLTAGTWNTSSGSPTMGTIIPRKLTAPGTLTGGGTALASYAALVIPQQMKGKKFIAVTLANGNTYYYTPTHNDDANLQSGRQHTYDITVKHGYLEVSTNTGGSAWGDGSAEGVTGKYLLDNYAPDKLKIGDYYYNDGETSDGGYRKYSDGSTKIEDIQPVLTDADGNERSVIGIVFWVGSIIGDDPLLPKKHSGCTHGLVAALQDAGQTLWSSSYEDITDNWLSKQDAYGIRTLKETEKMQGYANTKALEGYNASERATGGNSGYTVLPIGLIRSYADAHPAPASSSGWYFPSIKELKYMCWGQNASGESTGGKQMLDTQFAKVSGASSLQLGGYWSSTERVSYWAWYVGFHYGGVLDFGIKGGDSYCVRAVLAF